MNITLHRATSIGAVTGITVKREEGEPRIYKETAFWYKLKGVLNRGYALDLVKRNMEQDKHMMGDKHTHYLRDRKWRWCIYDGNYAIRFVYDDFNRDAEGAYLTVEHWEKNEMSGTLFGG